MGRQTLVTMGAVRYVLLRQRVSQLMDTTGWGSVLIMLDVVLSVASVVMYIVTTYGIAVEVCGGAAAVAF